MSAYQMHTPASSLPQGVAMANSHGTQKPPEEVTRKRELRLMKNREAARECRRKKKEYVKCLENRVAVLENQNNTLIEELRALKDIYRHKAEVAAKEHRRRKRDYLINLEALLAQLEAENKRLTAKLQYFQNTYGLQ
ncbi:unnamed protein product [Merluccius merluccius]